MESKSVVPAGTFSRRRLAYIAAGAVAALWVGYFAGQIIVPPRHTPAAAAPSGATGASGAVAPATGQTATGTTAGAGAGAGAGAPSPSASVGPPKSHAPLTLFRDRVAGFSISYPQGWTRVTSSKDAGVRLLVSGPGGGSLLVRLATLGVSISGRTLAELEALTGTKLKARPGVAIVAGPRLLSVNNLPGFLYIYSFIDPVTRQKSAHSQITLFSGKRMYTLVYQAAQAGSLVTLAPLFDQVTDTFHAG